MSDKWFRLIITLFLIAASFVNGYSTGYRKATNDFIHSMHDHGLLDDAYWESVGKP